jgi:hypothetical protein
MRPLSHGLWAPGGTHETFGSPSRKMLLDVHTWPLAHGQWAPGAHEDVQKRVYDAQNEPMVALLQRMNQKTARLQGMNQKIALLQGMDPKIAQPVAV